MSEMDYYATNADLYDYISPGAEGDVKFYVEEAQKAGSPVLELACGTARLLIPVARAGIEITGLDISAAMLSVAREKISREPDEVRERISLYEGDMLDLSLDGKFNLAFIAYGSFLHVLTPEDQRRVLNGIREHLAEDGKLIINIFDPGWDVIAGHMGPGGTSPRFMTSFRNEKTGRDIVVWDSRRYDPGNQTVRQHRIFEELDEQGLVISRRYASIDLRWTYRYEMQYLFELCGFEVEALYSDFKWTPFVPGYQQVWVTRKAG